MGCGWIGVWRQKNKSWTNGRFFDKKDDKMNTSFRIDSTIKSCNMNEKQNWIGEKKRWVFDDKQNRVLTIKSCKMNKKQNRNVEKKRWVFDDKQNRLNDKIMQYELKVELDWREKKMGV